MWVKSSCFKKMKRIYVYQMYVGKCCRFINTICTGHGLYVFMYSTGIYRVSIDIKRIHATDNNNVYVFLS